MKNSIIVDRKDSSREILSSLTRRKFLKAIGVGGAAIGPGILLGRFNFTRENKTESFIASVSDYRKDLCLEILRGLKELGIKPLDIKNKKVLVAIMIRRQNSFDASNKDVDVINDLMIS